MTPMTIRKDDAKAIGPSTGTHGLLSPLTPVADREDRPLHEPGVRFPITADDPLTNASNEILGGSNRRGFGSCCLSPDCSRSC